MGPNIDERKTFMMKNSPPIFIYFLTQLTIIGIEGASLSERIKREQEEAEKLSLP